MLNYVIPKYITLHTNYWFLFVIYLDKIISQFNISHLLLTMKNIGYI